MEPVKPTIQHGFGHLGERVIALPDGSTFDARKLDLKKKQGSEQKVWEAVNKKFPTIVRKQGVDYSKLKKDQLLRLVAKYGVRLNKGENVKEADVKTLTGWLKDWEQFKR